MTIDDIIKDLSETLEDCTSQWLNENGEAELRIMFSKLVALKAELSNSLILPKGWEIDRAWYYTKYCFEFTIELVNKSRQEKVSATVDYRKPGYRNEAFRKALKKIKTK